MLETSVNGLYGGTVEGYQMTAFTAGTVSTLSVYVDAASTATNLLVGLYGYNGGHPGTLLTSGTSTTFQKAGWNTLPVSPISIAAGSKYWFALLGTGGTMFFRQKPETGGWIDETHAVKALTSLASTWATGTVYAAGAWTSVYGSGVTGGTPVATPVTPPVAPPVLAVSPAALSWTAKVRTSNLAPDSVSITSTGAGLIAFTGVSDQPWLAISSATGATPSTLQIVPSTAGLTAGSYTGHVTLTGGGTTKMVTVVLSMTAPPSVQHPVSLSWKSPTAGTAVSYDMYRSIDAGGSYALVASAIIGTTYTDQTCNLELLIITDDITTSASRRPE